jgi:cytidylate kinase
MRDSEDSRRYLKLYDIDNSKFDFVDLKIDTALYNPEQIVELILKELENKGYIEM